MQRVDGFYLYKVGYQIHPIGDLRWKSDGSGAGWDDARFPLYVAESALEPLIHNSVFQLRTSTVAGEKLLEEIKKLRKKMSTVADESAKIDFRDLYPLTEALRNFEAVLTAELALSPIYVVLQKAGFDTTILVESGVRCFPMDVISKCPPAVSDLQQATKCLAFELLTASGFHFHRANESVLRLYWDSVTKGKTRPANGNMGTYLSALEKGSFGNAVTRTALRDLKDQHRNPLIHPEHVIDTADAAIALMNGVHNSITRMLMEMPEIAPPGSTPAGGIATSIS